MIIDSHTHTGRICQFDLPEEMLVDSLQKYGIDLALVSNLEANEFDSQGNLINDQLSQFEVNQKIVSLQKRYPERIKGLFWIKVHTEDFDPAIEGYLGMNRSTFCGLKLHPFHSKCPATDPRLTPWYGLAKKLGLPIAVHSSGDEFSRPDLLYQAAQDHPDVTFIMVHMGLGTDNTEAVEYICRLKNLFGDTTWVKAENALQAVRRCGSRKILFGTDAPIAGPETYSEYQELIQRFKADLSEDEFEDVFCNNARRIFSIKD